MVAPDLFSYLFSQTEPGASAPWAAHTGALFSFGMKVLIPKKLSPRDGCFKEHESTSRNFCARLLNEHASFAAIEMVVLPERWLSPVEEINFFDLLMAHPGKHALREMHLVTQSLQLLGSVDPVCVRTYKGDPTGWDAPASAQGILSIERIRALEYARQYVLHQQDFTARPVIGIA